VEIIPERVVEMALDFYNHLGPIEKEVFGNKYFERQPELINYTKQFFKRLKLNDAVYLEYAEILVILFRCYDYYDLRIPDVLGNEVYSQPINNSTQSTINISYLSNGMYFYRITSDKETMQGKFMKQ